MNILQNNPYRLLGVYSNSPTKERLANHNRIKAFLKVGKQVSFPLDLPKYLSPINRTDASVADAEAKLTLPKEQILYAQFWFVKITPLDNIAFIYLLAGKMDKAEEIWRKKRYASSLQNRIVCALMSNDYNNAITCAETLYDNAQHLSRLTSAIIGTSENFDTSKLAFSFLDVLYDEIGANKLLSVITNATWRKHIEERAVKPLIDNIQDAINTAKKSKEKGSDARLNAGEILKKNTQNALSQLKGFLSPTDLQYQMIADKLGLEILQCGIDYYNGSEEPDAAKKAMVLQGYAMSIVVGQMAKDRCKENVDILQKIINNLPPSEVFAEDRAIQSKLKNFSSQPNLISFSILLIKECVPYVVSIKEKIGNCHKYYLSISTTIVNKALNNVIDQVNNAQEQNDFAILKSTLIEAWRTQLYLDKFDLLPEYKNGRYKQSRDILHKIISDCKGFESYYYSDRYKYGCGWCNNLSDKEIDLRTDDEFYMSCHDITSFRAYEKRFPIGKHIKDIKEKIAQYENEQKARIAKQDKAITACHTVDDVIALYKQEKTNKIDADKCSNKAYELAITESDYKKVIDTFGIYSSGGKQAKSRVDEIEHIRLKKRTKLKWSLSLLVPIGISGIVYLIWGIDGFRIVCSIINIILFFGAIGFVFYPDRGCLRSFVCVIILFLLVWLNDILHESSYNATKYEQTKSENSSYEYPYNATSSSNADEDYDTCIYSDIDSAENDNTLEFSLDADNDEAL